MSLLFFIATKLIEYANHMAKWTIQGLRFVRGHAWGLVGAFLVYYLFQHYVLENLMHHGSDSKRKEHFQQDVRQIRLDQQMRMQKAAAERKIIDEQAAKQAKKKKKSKTSTKRDGFNPLDPKSSTSSYNNGRYRRNTMDNVKRGWR